MQNEAGRQKGGGSRAFGLSRNSRGDPAAAVPTSLRKRLRSPRFFFFFSELHVVPDRPLSFSDKPILLHPADFLFKVHSLRFY